MDLSYALTFARVVLRELWQNKLKALLCFAVVSTVVLVVGMFWPSTYSSSATIFADNQNILKPILAQKAAVSRVQEKIRIVREAIYSRSLLAKVVEEQHGKPKVDSPMNIEQSIGVIRKSLIVDGLGSSYVNISYSSDTAEKAFDVLNAVIDKFISESIKSRRAESKEAFQFVDSQVRQYKGQLLSAEVKLKEFNEGNFDGNGAGVGARIARLRSDIEEMKINIDEERSRVESLSEQLSREGRQVARNYKSDVFRNRLVELQGRIDSLLLTYQESYPDVVNLRLQMDDITGAMLEAESEEVAGLNVGEVNVNPFYEQLRSKLAEAEVALTSRLRRMAATERLLNEEYERRKRIAGQQSELSELTRDYDVIKSVYNDMLGRKEKARLSMTLSNEGQGMNYKIQEPPVYPIAPEGLRFLHFVLLGPALGLLASLGLAFVYVLLDDRVRFPADLPGITPVPVLAVVPHVRTQFTQRLARIDMVWAILLGLTIMVSYLGLALAHRAGMLL